MKKILLSFATMLVMPTLLEADDSCFCSSKQCACACVPSIERKIGAMPRCVKKVTKKVHPERHKKVEYTLGNGGCESKKITIQLVCPPGTQKALSKEKPVETKAMRGCCGTVTKIVETAPVCEEVVFEKVSPKREEKRSVVKDAKGCPTTVIEINYSCPAGAEEEKK